MKKIIQTIIILLFFINTINAQEKENSKITVILTNRINLAEEFEVIGTIKLKNIGLKGIIKSKKFIIWEKINGDENQYYSAITSINFIPANTEFKLKILNTNKIQKKKPTEKKPKKKYTNPKTSPKSSIEIEKFLNSLAKYFTKDKNGNLISKKSDLTNPIIPIIDPKEFFITKKGAYIPIKNLEQYDLTIDSNNNIVSISPPDGFTYNSNGNLVPITAPNGYTYDSNRNLVPITTPNGYTYDSNGKLVPITAPDGYTYNTNGKLVPITAPDGYTYDKNGNLILIADANGFTYDANGNLLSITTPDGHTYDADGNLISITAPNGYTYDATGNLIPITDSNGYTYDATGNLIPIADIKKNIYNENGNLIPIAEINRILPTQIPISTPIETYTRTDTSNDLISNNNNQNRNNRERENNNGGIINREAVNNEEGVNNEEAVNNRETVNEVVNNRGTTNNERENNENNPPSLTTTSINKQICSTKPNYSTLEVILKFKNITTRSDRSKITTNCGQPLNENTITKPIVKDYDKCNLRNDFHQQKSFKQAQFYYYNNNGDKINLKNCADTSVSYRHQYLAENCQKLFDKTTNTIYPRRKTFIDNNGKIEIITNCEIYSEKEIATNKQKEILKEVKLDIANNKVFMMFKEYYNIDEKKFYVTPPLVDASTSYDINKNYVNSCNIEHDLKNQKSYRKYNLEYTNHNQKTQTIENCIIDKNEPFTHITQTITCQPIYINRILYKQQKTIIIINNNNIQVSPCTPTNQLEKIVETRIRRNFESCNTKINYDTKKAYPQFKNTYPIGTSYKTITDCTSDSSLYYQMVLTKNSCEADINTNLNIAKEKQRYSYYNGEDTILVGECNTHPTSQIFAIETDNSCPMRISLDKNYLIRYEKKYYAQRNGKLKYITECQEKNPLQKISINPYLEKDYDNCNISVSNNFILAYKNYRTFVNIPNGIKQLLKNCKNDGTTDSYTIYKNYDSCVPLIDTLNQNPKVTMRAKIYYVYNGEEIVIQNCATLSNEIHNLTKNYTACEPKQIVRNNKIHRYYQWEYTRFGNIFPISTKCALEKTSQTIILDQFSCSTIQNSNNVLLNNQNEPIKATTNNINFYHNLNQGFSLVQSKKIYKEQDNTWSVLEPCTIRPELGNFVHSYISCGYTHDDANIRSITKLQREFLFPFEKIVNNDEDNEATIKKELPDTCGTTGNFIPIPYTYLGTTKYNKSDFKGTSSIHNSPFINNGHPIRGTRSRPNIFHQPIITTATNKDGGISKTKRQQVDRFVTVRDHASNLAKQRQTSYITTITNTHKIVTVSKLVRADNVVVYYLVNEYFTTENAPQDLADDNINYDTLIRHDTISLNN